MWSKNEATSRGDLTSMMPDRSRYAMPLLGSMLNCTAASLSTSMGFGAVSRSAPVGARRAGKGRGGETGRDDCGGAALRTMDGLAEEASSSAEYAELSSLPVRDSEWCTTGGNRRVGVGPLRSGARPGDRRPTCGVPPGLLCGASRRDDLRSRATRSTWSSSALATEADADPPESLYGSGMSSSVAGDTSGESGAPPSDLSDGVDEAASARDELEPGAGTSAECVLRRGPRVGVEPRARARRRGGGETEGERPTGLGRGAERRRGSRRLSIWEGWAGRLRERRERVGAGTLAVGRVSSALGGVAEVAALEDLRRAGAARESGSVTWLGRWGDLAWV